MKHAHENDPARVASLAVRVETWALRVGAAIALVAAVWTYLAYAGYREAREHWREARDRLGQPTYDADESDRRYLRVEDAWKATESGLRVGGASVLVAAVAWGARRRRRG